MTPLPQYQCHKKVWALRITGIQSEDGENEAGGGAILSVESPNGSYPPYSPIVVNSDYTYKHKPEVGGYWVQYDDGYISYSPAKAFEEGYSLIG